MLVMVMVMMRMVMVLMMLAMMVMMGDHEDVCRLIAKAGTKMEMVVERGDHIVPSFEEIWPSRGPTKRVKRGVEYYLDAMEDNGLKGNLEIKQYNNPMECYDEKTIEDMTDEMEMMSNPNLVEKRKEMKEQKTGGPVHGYDPAKSQVIPVLAEHNQASIPGWKPTPDPSQALKE